MLAIECDQDGEMYVVKYRLPVACAFHGTYQSGAFRTEISARRDLCAKIVATSRVWDGIALGLDWGGLRNGGGY